jgi:hypothetical protein
MSQDLINDRGEHFRCSNGFWAAALVLAQEYGWVQAGTVDPLQGPTDGQWTGRYSLNNGQVVRTEDADEIGAALERALQTLPDVPQAGWLLRGEFRQHVVVLAKFCRHGRFRIY